MTLDPRVKAVADIKTKLLFDLVVDLNPGLKIGDGGFGRRVLFGSAGRSFEGPRLRGEALPGGVIGRYFVRTAPWPLMCD